MRRFALAVAAVVVLGLGYVAIAGEKAPPEPAGMVSLFNGKDLTGWDGDPRLWSVKDGVIHGETTAEKKTNGNTFLIWTGGTVKDFELRLSFKCKETNNSGVQYRSKHLPASKDNKWIVQGYQAEIRNEIKLPSVSGFIYDEKGKRGRLCLVGEKAEWHGEGKDGKKVVGQLCTPEEYTQAFKLNDWNEYVIIGKGDNIKHYINGLQVVDFTDDPKMALHEGIIALQLHAGAPFWVEFKDIRVKQD